jgi:hypothetical protein
MIGWDCPSPDLTLSAADMPRERRRRGEERRVGQQESILGI